MVTPAPIAMGAGALIRYRLRVHRVPVGWLTEIREWARRHRFVDEQLRGPYACGTTRTSSRRSATAAAR